MASAAAIIAIAGAITLGNEALNAPYVRGNTDVLSKVNWRVIPATGVAAAVFAGLDTVDHQIAVGLAAVALGAVLFTKIGNAPSPAYNLAKAMGYNVKGTG